MTPKRKALLTVECREMKNPKLQRSRFDETLVNNSWIFQENKSPDIHGNGTVSTTTIWGRTYSAKTTDTKIRKQAGNLLARAAKYADIDDYDMNLEICQITRPEDDFQGTPVLLQDD